MLEQGLILVTGAAGFIGSFLCKKLISDYPNLKVVGIDNLNDYYDVKLKEDRLASIKKLNGNFEFIKMDISNKDELDKLFNSYHFDYVVNLAAQAGVRYSIDHPDNYIKSNIIGFFNILEEVRFNKVKHLVYASSSSVYGGNTKIPFSEDDKVNTPVSLYAATKASDELLAYSYSKLYDIPLTGLRFFTVYGPMGRPDMAYFSFAEKLINNQDIEIFNYGNCKRDFTYIDDVVNGIVKVIANPPKTEVKSAIYNIGNNHPENLMEFVNILSSLLKEEGMLNADFDFNKHIRLLPMQKGDVEVTFADTSKLEKMFGYKPNTSLKDGLRNFVSWYKEYKK